MAAIFAPVSYIVVVHYIDPVTKLDVAYESNIYTEQQASEYMTAVEAHALAKNIEFGFDVLAKNGAGQWFKIYADS